MRDVRVKTTVFWQHQMIILQEQKVMFLHIPKSGGTSLAEYLDPIMTWRDICIGGTALGEEVARNWSQRYGLYKHSSPSEVMASIGEKAYREFVKIIIVRDPVRRFLSALMFLRSDIVKSSEWFSATEESKYVEFDVSVDEFIESAFLKNVLDKKESTYTDVQKFFLPQCLFYDQDEAAAGRFKVLRLEDISCDQRCLRELVCAALPETFPHANKTWSEADLVVGAREKEKIRNIYSSDYEKFYS